MLRLESRSHTRPGRGTEKTAGRRKIVQTDLIYECDQRAFPIGTGLKQGEYRRGRRKWRWRIHSHLSESVGRSYNVMQPAESGCLARFSIDTFTDKHLVVTGPDSGKSSSVHLCT